MERGRLQELVERATTSPREVLVQKQLKAQLYHRNTQYELYKDDKRVVIDKMTIQNIMSLRKGPFTTVPFQMADINLRNIVHLDLAVLPFGEKPVVHKKAGTSNFYGIPKPAHAVSGSPTSPTSPIDPNAPSGTHYTKEQRSGYKILHDFLASFPRSQITFFRFEWIGRLAGPNPLLLHNIPVEATGRDTWFSAPPLSWKALQKIRLKGVDLKDEDVVTLIGQNPKLKSLIVETFWTDEQIAKGLASGDPDQTEIDVLA